MELRQREAGGEYVSLALIGSLDMTSIASVETRFLVATVGGGKHTIVDLSELTFVDSTGLHALVLYARENNARGPLILANPSGFVLRVMQIMKLDGHPALEIRMDGDGQQ